MTAPNTELPKAYDPSAVEDRANQTWQQENCFSADPAAPGEPYCIVIPPPNVTGALHLGHALNNTLQDILIRRARMMGYNTLWIPGIDHAGIATQAVVEKQLKEKENKTRHDVGREGLIQRIWDWKNEYGNRIISQLQRIGCSCDWNRTVFTLDKGPADAVRETFFKLFKDGLVYRGKRLVNWDTHLQTSISDDELYKETVRTSLWSIRYPIDGTGEFVTIATTRPETMLADTAVAYHSSNPRAAFLKGKFVRLPLTSRLIPLIEDDILVDPEFGTGFVKVTPGHDPNDYAVYTRHKGTPTEIDILNLMTPDGKVNDANPAWAPYAGLRLDTAARKKVLEDLAALGLHNPETDVKPHDANVDYSDRSKTPIQPYLSDQWFVQMAPLADPALDVVREGKVKFFPERHSQQYLAWLGEKRDWPISRQLWWGHRIPVWSSRAGLENPKRALEVLQELRRRFPGRIAVTHFETGAAGADGLTPIEVFVCLSPDSADLQEVIESYGFTQDDDVLDTWFSSGLWPHSTLGWPEQTDELAKWYPGSVLLTGRDIITLWVARMVMMGLYNMGDIPFHHVAINPTILDGKGERMSKSKGNGVDPVDIIETHGADALRFTLATMATETQDVRMPVKKDAQGRNTSDKFDLGRNFANKLWNAVRFALANLEGIAPEPVDETRWSLADRWIVTRLLRALQESDAALAVYRFDLYAKACYDFFWRDFCDWYVEAIKPAMKDPARRGQTASVLAAVLDGALRLMHPVIPFITETLWWRLDEIRPHNLAADTGASHAGASTAPAQLGRSLPGRLILPPSKRLILARWPAMGEAGTSDAAEFLFPRFQEIIAAIRNVRNEHKVPPSKTIDLSIKASDQQAMQISMNRELIETLAGVNITAVGPAVSQPHDAAKSLAADVELYLASLVDPAAESARIEKRRDDLTKLIAQLEGRLGNESYIAKAPPKLVQETKDQLAKAQVELAALA